jgi:hypothetical protein
MMSKPHTVRHIVRLIADKASELYYQANHRGNDLPQPRVINQEIGVLFWDNVFIPYADLGYNDELGFYQLSACPDATNESTPYAAEGPLLDPGQLIVTPGVAKQLSNDELSTLLERHTSGDFGDLGRFYEIDVTDEMLLEGVSAACGMSKVSVLTGLDSVISEYMVRDTRIWVITEPGEQRSTIFTLAGVERHSRSGIKSGNRVRETLR